ncbi:MAG: hypothetical protein IPP85_18940 [Propionivibrio sp.]|nr:hypothetical protein [Propionivibrio sp.]
MCLQWVMLTSTLRPADVQLLPNIQFPRVESSEQLEMKRWTTKIREEIHTIAVIFARTPREQEKSKRGGRLTPRVRRLLIFVDGKRSVEDCVSRL